MNDPADRLYERLLVLRCQTGDETAFTELVARYQPRLRYFVRRLLDDDTVAEDVLQDAWLDVYRGLGKLADAGAFPAWLYRIARDRAFRVLRKRRPDSLPHDATDLAAEPDPGEFTAEDAARIHAALGRLAPEHREVLILRFLEEMSYDDIARIACCPLGTVRSRLHHAKLALRRILEKEP